MEGSHFPRCYRVRDDIFCCECLDIQWNCAVNYTCPITPVITYNDYTWLYLLLIIGTLVLSIIFIFLRSRRNRRMYDEVGVDPLAPRGLANQLSRIRVWSTDVIRLFRTRVSDEIPMMSI